MRHNCRSDHFFRRAKKEGYRSRSAYKLKEIQKRFQLIRRGDRVLDLGSSPGGFLQVIREAVGEKGVIVGVDLMPIPPLPYGNIHLYRGDVRTIDMGSIMAKEGIQAFDVMTSDLSPNLSGITEVDEKRTLELFESCKEIARNYLRAGGYLLFKTFFFPSFKSMKKQMEGLFERCLVIKPQASKKESSEVYLLCLNKR
jgi:23S rRNA (uridine2552-2'-O)-methyltransferase